VDFRDPRRDKEHGRIWRVTATSAPADRRPTLAQGRDLRALSTTDLLTRTLSDNGWDQEQARLVLRQRDADPVLAEAKAWLARQSDPRARLEVLWLHSAFERSSEALIRELAAAPDERLRMAAAQQLAR
jgi:hypothetical protein